MFSLTQGLRRALQTRPTGPSTAFAPRRRTWEQTADRVARVAGALAALGVKRGDRVAILALNSDRYFELMYAIPWIGAVMVPINTRLAAPEIEYILEDSGSVALFIDGTMAHHLTALDGKMPSVREVIWLDDISGARGHAALRGPHRLRAGRGCRRGRRRPRRPVLHRRHDRTVEGRDADAHQPRGERPERGRRHGLRRRHRLHPFRRDVPSRRRRLDLRRDAGRRPPRLRAALRAGRGAADHRPREDHARAVRADHDQHAGQPRALRRVRHLDPQAHPLRRLADARGRAAQGDGGDAACRA